MLPSLRHPGCARSATPAPGARAAPRSPCPIRGRRFSTGGACRLGASCRNVETLISRIRRHDGGGARPRHTSRCARDGR